MAAALTPYAQPEPFEEMTVAGQRPPDELEEYYQQLERVELERRASKKSRWSRKSFRGVDMHIEELVKARELRAQREREDRERATPDGSRAPSPDPASGPPTHWQQQQQPPQQQQQHSAWTSPTALANPIYKKYDIFNPAGPKYYTNYHLSPKSDMRAPSVFSPNFPAFPSTPEVPSQDTNGKQLTFETRSTPEHMLTPDGAGERFPQPSGGKLRRKSPTTTPADERGGNSLARSATVAPRMTPSPLSQSVTTLPPHVPDSQHLREPPRITRKLSKRNSQTGRGIRGMFARSTTSDTEDTRVGPGASSASLATMQSRPRPVSIAVPPQPVVAKRMSVFGKLAKKLSLAKHVPAQPQGMTVERSPLNTPPAAAQSARPPLGAVSSAENGSSGNGHAAGDGDGNPARQDRGRRSPSPSAADWHRRRAASALDGAPEPHAAELHNGALVTSPPAIVESHSEPILHHAPPPSEGRSSPDAQFHIGNLMITNPDEYAATEPSSTPRAPPAALPRFHAASLYSDAGATANSSTGSLPLARLQVINPSAPTPDPQEQLDALRREREREQVPPMPPQQQPPQEPFVPAPVTHDPAPQPAASRSDVQLPKSRSDVQLAAVAAPPIAASRSDSQLADAPPARRTDSDKSERRVSRKPPPTILPAHDPPRAQQDPTTLAMAKYVAENARERDGRRDMLTVDGQEWEVVPVKERKRTTSKLERSSSKKPEREPSARKRTLSKPERSSGALQREQSRAPSPPPKSVQRYRLDRKVSTDTRASPTPAPESPTKGDRNKPTPLPPAPSKLPAARPTSEVFEEHAPQLRAREAFDAERMRKGMSYAGGGARDAELPLPPVPSREPSYEAERGAPPPQRVKSLGSGHTAFVMTPPIVGQPRPGAF